MQKSFINKITDWCKSKKGKPDKDVYGLDNLNEDLIGYLELPAGLPAVKNTVLFERMGTEIKTMRNELGLEEKAFNEYILPVLINFSEFVHLLPASQYHHHSTGGGLLFHSFDVAIRSMKHESLKEYIGEDVNLKEDLEYVYKWKSGALIAGLLHDSGKVLTDFIVSNGEKNNDEIIWSPYGVNSIAEWCDVNQLSKYFVRWVDHRKGKHNSASITLIDRLVPSKTRVWMSICQGENAIKGAIIDAILGEDLVNLLCKVVSECDKESSKQDMRNRNRPIEKKAKLTPISIIITDLIRYYIESENWTINEENSKVWFVDNELYLVWSLIAPRVIEVLTSMGYEGHEDPNELAWKVVKEGIAINDGALLYFHVEPKIPQNKYPPKLLTVLKVTAIQKIISEHQKLISIGQYSINYSGIEASNGQQRLDDQVTSVEAEPVVMPLPVIDLYGKDEDKKICDYSDNPTKHFKRHSLPYKKVDQRIENQEKLPTSEEEKITIVFNNDIINYINKHYDFEVNYKKKLVIPKSVVYEIAEKMSQNTEFDFSMLTIVAMINDLEETVIV